ncbi:MAG: outer membrane protein assembly factor BamE domain-containing protein [Thiomonas sp.]
MKTTLTRRSAFAATVLAAALLAGCASAGNEALSKQTSASLNQHIQKGVTTKEQVQAILGQPQSVSFNGGQEQWTYNFAHATPTAVDFVPLVNLFVHHANVDHKMLVILFDKNGVVENYSYTHGQSVYKSGVGQ